MIRAIANPGYLQKIGRETNRRLLEVERVRHNSGLSGDSIQRVVQPAVTEDGENAPPLQFGQPRVMALLLALSLFHHLIDGFHNRDLRTRVVDLLGVTSQEYTASCHQALTDWVRNLPNGTQVTRAWFDKIAALAIMSSYRSKHYTRVGLAVQSDEFLNFLGSAPMRPLWAIVERLYELSMEVE